MITVVGMGNKSEDLTQLGAKTIKNAQVVVVKSALTHMKNTVESIRNDALYCDFIYETSFFEILFNPIDITEICSIIYV